MSKDRKYLSRIADHFYNQTNFREGSATELVVSEIEGIYQQGGGYCVYGGAVVNSRGCVSTTEG